MARDDDVRGPTVLLFGPQTRVSSAVETLSKLRSSLQSQESEPHWTVTMLAEMPSYWDAWVAKIPALHVVRGGEVLAKLSRWLTKGLDASDVADIADYLPNTLLVPLVVLTQLRQFERYAECRHGSLERGLEDLRNQQARSLGFCTGLLSAYVVASSCTRKDFEKYGAVALRLAALVGAVVDAYDDDHGKALSFATSLQTRQQEVDLGHIIEELRDDAYTSVLYDEYKKTVTVSEKAVEAFLLRLRLVGIKTTELGLHGRFHDPAHQYVLDAILQLCEGDERLQLPHRSALHMQSFTNNSVGEPLEDGPLHRLALQALLVQQADWHDTFAEVCHKAGGHISIVSFSAVRCVPPSLRASFSLQHIVDATDVDPLWRSPTPTTPPPLTRDNDIAIIGLSIKVAGADDVDELSTLLRSGVSQHTEVDASRIPFGASSTPWRPDPPGEKLRWFGNFVRDVDAFDHRFFRRSPRESAAMDPQQRLFLQAAYQAVETAGWFSRQSREQEENRRPDAHVGVYLGTCSTDYEHNIACHPPGAFSATGLLRSFIAGKVSHHFGWTGPSVTFDTACSGSAVAIHTACKALLHGECSAALCGGVNLMGTPLWFQNLAGASFLSPTGQCKPFDELADGYCRGEGIGCVFLKPMKAAIADGDRIFGCIASTAVYQNDNSTPVFVPNAPSLSRLFVDVVRDAGLKPRDISLVEAHGTGTPIGDPAEYQSIRQALAGNVRKKPLAIGSIKGLIGHTESASGIASLIKVIVLMNEAFIPAQPSFSKLSHHLDASIEDMIDVPTTLRPWSEAQKAALINNYGASGSNASLVVRQAPYSDQAPSLIHSCARHPFRITGLDGRSIEAYCTKLADFVKRKSHNLSLADVAFNLARRSNHSFTRGIFFGCSTPAELLQKLSSKIEHREIMPPRPVILCFGGQSSRCIGLNRKVYEGVRILQKHLDDCNATIRSLGLDGIFPDIFSKHPIADPVKLQTALFALQYACAKSWMDCGVRIDAVVGHSFGEITALCISGVLTLRDAVKLIAARARLVRDAWGQDHGAMMAVEADLSTIERLLAEANRIYGGESPASVACHNGPRSFTLAGSTEAMATVKRTISGVPEYDFIKSKTLNVTHAFHSILVEPLLPALRRIGDELTFNKPRIPIERATKSAQSGSSFTRDFVAEHMRDPVFFNSAVKRLAERYPRSVWLEAGSASTITAMASRAVAPAPDMHFQALNITIGGSIESLSDTTVALWNEGVHTDFWAHHGSQTHEYKPLLLPPYQFENTRHWLPFKSVTDAFMAQQGPRPAAQNDMPLSLWTFERFLDNEQRHARFRINTESERYKSLISGHVVVQTAPICPATVEIAMAVETLLSLIPAAQPVSNLQPIVRDVQNHVALCVDPAREVWLDLRSTAEAWRECVWKIVTSRVNDKAGHEILCVDGRIELRSSEDVGYRREYARFQRLTDYQACSSLLQDAEGAADDVLQGRNVYRAFSEVVDYGASYQGVKRVVGNKNECAGTVELQPSSDTWLDVPFLDSCCQVAGVWVNCMTERKPEDVFLATGCELMMRSPTGLESNRPTKHHVFARHHCESSKVYTTDVFVFNPDNGQLVQVILGVHYERVAKTSLSKILTRLTGDPSVLRRSNPTTAAADKPSIASLQEKTYGDEPEFRSLALDERTSKPARPDIRQELRRLIASVCGVEPEEIHEHSEMTDLGIDSLMGMELSREVENKFGCRLDHMELLEATSFSAFVICTSRALYGTDGDLGGESGEDEDGSDHSTTISHALGETSTAPTTATTRSPVIPASDEYLSFMKPVTGASLTDKMDNNGDLSPQDVLAAFNRVKWTTDQRLIDAKLDDTDSVIIARSNRLCVALVVEAFEHLGCALRSASAGQILTRIPHQPQHGRFVDWLYSFLCEDARLIDIKEGKLIRTSISAPRKSSGALYHDLLQRPDSWIVAHKLTHLAGTHLADVLQGKIDGVSLLFGSAEGRSLVEALYCDLPYNRLAYEQIRDVVAQIVSRHPSGRGPFKILEMGAGTGGTTRIVVPFLAKMNVPVEYTFTDLSPSMVAQARRRFKAYPFMQFAVHDIQTAPVEDLRGQHVVLASNAVHATQSLRRSACSIREALREDGVLLLTEMTEGLPFVDVVFGLLEGWWLFDDGRSHALVSEKQWEKGLKAAGFGHVDWTDGEFPENRIQRVIMAMASGVSLSRFPKLDPYPSSFRSKDALNGGHHEAEAERYVAKFSVDFATSPPKPISQAPLGIQRASRGCVILTGGTGSLGSHLAAAFASRSDIAMVICLNRRSNSTPAEARQREALSSRGISISPTAQAKIAVFEIDGTGPNLGLSEEQYAFVISNMTHIVHNAWPMSATRPLRGFEAQFLMLRQLLDLAVAAHDHSGTRITFQFISSIGVVGGYPAEFGDPEVPETRVPFTSVPRIGYCEAKWVCERILDETLHRHPQKFRTMVIRPGQISGSRISGYWNPVEHFAFLVKSAQGLQAIPALRGRMQWLPVDDVAATIIDLAMRDGEVYPVYHVDNPVGQPWEEMIPILGRELGLPDDGSIIPFRDWIRKVKRSPLSAETDNPASRLVDFLENHFERMSCGGLILDVARATEHSKTLAETGPVQAEVVRRYIRAWKESGFLSEL